MKKIMSVVLVLTMVYCSLVGSSCFAAETPSTTETQVEVQKTEPKFGKWKKALYAALAVLGTAGAAFLAKNCFSDGTINPNVRGLNDENICLPCDYNSNLNFSLNNSNETKVTNLGTSSALVPCDYYQNNEKSNEDEEVSKVEVGVIGGVLGLWLFIFVNAISLSRPVEKCS